MKKCIICFGIAALAFTACKNEKPQPDNRQFEQTDSLQRIISQRDNEINDMLGTLNEIQEGFRQINEAENRVTIAKDGERGNKTQQIRDNIKFISSTMQRNRELITKLRQQLRESSFNGDQLKRTIDALTGQLEEKDRQLQALRMELDSKDIHISELDETINNLNTSVSNLKAESTAKTETINSQETQLNTAWYVFGTKHELKEQRIIDGNRILEANFNKNYFTKVDIRVDKEIKLYSKSAKVMSMHPASSYTLTQDANKQYILRILNPQIFWSTSKYLVILVK